MCRAGSVRFGWGKRDIGLGDRNKDERGGGGVEHLKEREERAHVGAQDRGQRESRWGKGSWLSLAGPPDKGRREELSGGAMHAMHADRAAGTARPRAERERERRARASRARLGLGLFPSFFFLSTPHPATATATAAPRPPHCCASPPPPPPPRPPPRPPRTPAWPAKAARQERGGPRVPCHHSLPLCSRAPPPPGRAPSGGRPPWRSGRPG